MRACCLLGIRTSHPAEYWANTDPRIFTTTLQLLEQQDAAERG
jgi:hypothetical protein